MVIFIWAKCINRDKSYSQKIKLLLKPNGIKESCINLAKSYIVITINLIIMRYNIIREGLISMVDMELVHIINVVAMLFEDTFKIIYLSSNS